jgi:hypothetical protein
MSRHEEQFHGLGMKKISTRWLGANPIFAAFTCGSRHFFPEEIPDKTAEALSRFFSADSGH